MQTTSVIQVLPAANDSTTFYVSMQPTTGGKTTAQYVAPAITFVPSTNTLNVAGSLGVTGNVYVNAVYTNGLYYASNGAVISTSSGSSGSSGGTGTTTSQILINSTLLTSSYTIASNTNGFSVGPLTYANGVSISVASGQRWVII
jgi:hypothetical protein